MPADRLSRWVVAVACCLGAAASGQQPSDDTSTPRAGAADVATATDAASTRDVPSAKEAPPANLAVGLSGSVNSADAPTAAEAPATRGPLVMIAKCPICPAFPPRPSAQLDRWREAAEPDPLFIETVDSLRSRHHTSLAWLYSGAAVTLVGVVTSFAVSMQCPQDRVTECPLWAVPLSLAISGAVAITTTVGYLLTRPDQAELARALNEWNLSHLSDPVDPAAF